MPLFDVPSMQLHTAGDHCMLRIEGPVLPVASVMVELQKRGKRGSRHDTQILQKLSWGSCPDVSLQCIVLWQALQAHHAVQDRKSDRAISCMMISTCWSLLSDNQVWAHFTGLGSYMCAHVYMRSWR